MDREFNDEEREGRGESPMHSEFEDDVDSETENMMRQLKSFKRSGWWNNSEDERISSDDDESCESSVTEEIIILKDKENIERK